jgi:hypothetical protein
MFQLLLGLFSAGLSIDWSHLSQASGTARPPDQLARKLVQIWKNSFLFCPRIIQCYFCFDLFVYDCDAVNAQLRFN